MRPWLAVAQKLVFLSENDTYNGQYQRHPSLVAASSSDGALTVTPISDADIAAAREVMKLLAALGACVRTAFAIIARVQTYAAQFGRAGAKGVSMPSSLAGMVPGAARKVSGVCQVESDAGLLTAPCRS